MKINPRTRKKMAKSAMALVKILSHGSGWLTLCVSLPFFIVSTCTNIAGIAAMGSAGMALVLGIGIQGAVAVSTLSLASTSGGKRATWGLVALFVTALSWSFSYQGFAAFQNSQLQKPAEEAFYRESYDHDAHNLAAAITKARAVALGSIGNDTRFARLKEDRATTRLARADYKDAAGGEVARDEARSALVRLAQEQKRWEDLAIDDSTVAKGDPDARYAALKAAHRKLNALVGNLPSKARDAIQMPEPPQEPNPDVDPRALDAHRERLRKWSLAFLAALAGAIEIIPLLIAAAAGKGRESHGGEGAEEDDLEDPHVVRPRGRFDQEVCERVTDWNARSRAPAFVDGSLELFARGASLLDVTNRVKQDAMRAEIHNEALLEIADTYRLRADSMDDVLDDLGHKEEASIIREELAKRLVQISLTDLRAGDRTSHRSNNSSSEPISGQSERTSGEEASPNGVGGDTLRKHEA